MAATCVDILWYIMLETEILVIYWKKNNNKCSSINYAKSVLYLRGLHSEEIKRLIYGGEALVTLRIRIAMIKWIIIHHVTIKICNVSLMYINFDGTCPCTLRIFTHSAFISLACLNKPRIFLNVLSKIRTPITQSH